MFILKKVFQLRDKTQKGEEVKPFLEHLEDLRIVITRVVITLLIAMGVCFAFRNELMHIIRKPVEQVWKISQSAKMPDNKDLTYPLDLDTWEMAKKAVRDTALLTPAQSDYYFKHLDPDGSLHLKFHAESARYYRAAIDMENSNKTGITFLKGLPDISEPMRKQVLALMDKEKRPDAAIDSHGKLVMMQALNPTEGFMLSIKLAFFAGIVISFPLLLLFILQFILPGLKQNEKKVLWPALAIGFGLFLTGVLFSYFFVLPKVLDFFYTYSQDMGVTNEWRIGYYISFATQFTLIFGISFELPVIVMVMVKLGILDYEMMKNTRSYAILAIVIIAALITPTPDAFTLLLLAGPMIFLYEICIWLAYFDNKKQRQAELEEEAALQKKFIAPPAHTASRDVEEDVDEEDYHDFEEEEHDFSQDEAHEGEEHDLGEHDFSEEELEKDYYPETHRPEDCLPPSHEDSDDTSNSENHSDDQ